MEGDIGGSGIISGRCGRISGGFSGNGIYGKYGVVSYGGSSGGITKFKWQWCHFSSKQARNID